MSSRQHQYTIRRLMMLIVAVAIFLALLRIFSPTITTFTAVVIVGFLIERRRRGTGVLGGTIAGGIAFPVYALGMYAYLYTSPEPDTVDYVGPVITLPVMFGEGLVWGLMVSVVLSFVLNRPRRRLDRNRLIDDACSPIVWRGFDET